MSTSDFNTGQFNWRFYASNIRANPGQNLTLDASGNSRLSVTTNGTERFQVSDSSSVFFTNLDISGNGLRLRGNMSNATFSNNLLIQTNSQGPTSATTLGIIPGTGGIQTRFFMFDNSNPDTAKYFGISHTSSLAQIVTGDPSGGSTNVIPLRISTSLPSNNGSTITLDTSANFSTAPNCSVTATLPTNLINKSYFDASFGSWISFTPTTYQPFPTTVSTSTNTGYYFRVGKLVIARYYIVYNASGTAGNSIAVTLPPVTASSNYTGLGSIASNCIGSASWYDANSQVGGVFQYSLSTNVFNTVVGLFYLYGGQATTGGSWFGQFPAVQIRTGHAFSATITYEAA